MSISPFAIKSPTSFGFDTPGAASAHTKSTADTAAAQSAADRGRERAPLSPVSTRSIDPMLLVYQERVETFRLLARMVHRGFNALVGRRPASRGTVRRLTSTMAINRVVNEQLSA